jgi:hypothetical protein
MFKLWSLTRQLTSVLNYKQKIKKYVNNDDLGLAVCFSFAQSWLIGYTFWA